MNLIWFNYPLNNIISHVLRMSDWKGVYTPIPRFVLMQYSIGSVVTVIGYIIHMFKHREVTYNMNMINVINMINHDILCNLLT